MKDLTDTPDAAGGDNAHKAAKADLLAFMDRIANLEEEKERIAEDIKELYGEFKSKGYDTKALKIVHSLSKKEKGVLEIVKLYGEHMGVFS